MQEQKLNRENNVINCHGSCHPGPVFAYINQPWLSANSCFADYPAKLALASPAWMDQAIERETVVRKAQDDV